MVWENDNAKSNPEDLHHNDDRKVNIKDNLFFFDGNKAHAVTPFEGERYSIVFYTIGKHEMASNQVNNDRSCTGISPSTNS